MIKRENHVYVGAIDNKKEIINNTIFFDLEHYVYKKPICIGVFGCCCYDAESEELVVTQYMIENKQDSIDILNLAEQYFINMYEKNGKRNIITFSGNNDFSVINYLFKKNNIPFSIDEHFTKIDLQKMYENLKKVSIGLKALEKEFGIIRDSELISGSNLAKTFGKIVRDELYFGRMPQDKKNKILLYNEQDVVSLFYIFVNWDKLNIENNM